MRVLRGPLTMRRNVVLLATLHTLLPLAAPVMLAPRVAAAQPRRPRLRGIAFGRDGDERIGTIATGSHSFESDAVMLDGEIAERMRVGARKAADELLEKYRWAMFTVGAKGDAAFHELATDAMTWNSLIHTTYFDQPEVAEMIARHIIEQTRATAPAA